MEEPWDALDTDLSSSVSLLRRCSNQPPNSLLPSHSSSPQQQPSSTTISPPRRLIPGPAASIQAAMHRKEMGRLNCNANPLPVISTQEYIHRVQEDSGEEFRRNPWVFAVDALRCDGVIDTTTLSAIKKCVNAERFDKVVAIVKSCTPNSLGDMMITLKDPTDTISASVHGKVLVGECGRLLTVGSVLILQKIVAFPSSSMACYLNITRSNIAKVISVDCEVQSFTEGDPNSTSVFCRNSLIPEKTPDPVSRTERVVGHVCRISSSEGKMSIVELMGKENNVQLSNLNSSRQIETAPDKFFDAFGCFLNSQRDNSGRTSQTDPDSVGKVCNLQDPDSDEKHMRVREPSSSPSIIGKLGNQKLQASGAQVNRGNDGIISTTEKPEIIAHAPVGTSSSSRSPNNIDDLDMCGLNDVQNQLHPWGISSAPGMAVNHAKRDIAEIIGGLKSLQRTESGTNSNVVQRQDDEEAKGENGVKKQRLTLISRTAVHGWTDEQLCILDMDED